LSSGTGRLAGCRGQSPGPLPVTADAGSARSGSLDPCGGARTMSGPLPALELLDIAKTYRVGSSMLSRKHELRAVRNVSLPLPHRAVVGLVGETGCGKSTLAKMLLGLEQPTSGSIRIFGRALEKISRKELSRIVQPVFQDPYSSL